MSRRPVRVDLAELPEALARAAAGDPTAVAFRTAGGYFYTRWQPLQTYLRRPEAEFTVHHVNRLKKDNRLRNLTVLRRDVHGELHRTLDRGLKSGVSPSHARWRAIIGNRRRQVGMFENWEIAVCVRDDCLRHRALGALSVFDGTILDQDVHARLMYEGPREMGFTFVGRGDGRVHHLTGIAGRTWAEVTNDEGRLLRRALLLVWSITGNQWRHIPLEGLLWVTAQGRHLRVLHSRSRTINRKGESQC